jgi:hypothetical protein
MTRALALLIAGVLLSLSGGASAEPLVIPHARTVIDRSVTFRPGVCTLVSSGAEVPGLGTLSADRLDYPHASKVDELPLPGGLRRFTVQYYEVGRFAGLRFDIQRK